VSVDRAEQVLDAFEDGVAGADSGDVFREVMVCALEPDRERFVRDEDAAVNGIIFCHWVPPWPVGFGGGHRTEAAPN
jgi:hypothetical protein